MKRIMIYPLVAISTLSISTHSNAATIVPVEKVSDLWSMIENSESWESWGGDSEVYGYISTRKNREGKTESRRAEVGRMYNASLARKWEIIYYLSNGPDDMSIFAVNNGDKTATFYELGELKDGAEYEAGDVVAGTTKSKPEQLSKAEFLADLIHDIGAIPVSLVNEYWNGVGKLPEITEDMKAHGIDGLYYFTGEIDRIVRNESENYSKLSKDWGVIYYSGGNSDGEMAFLDNNDGTAYAYPPRPFQQ